MFSNPRIPLSIGAIGGVGTLAYALGSGNFTLLIVLLVCLVALGLALAVYVWFLKMRKQKAAQGMSKLLDSHNASAQAGPTGAEARVQLDDLRQQFTDGLGKFREAGKDLYSMPWYVLVGEPGSGKTEAIRKSNIGFPPGLVDRLQGAGGTMSMHWWFTNSGVILDTAGKLFFEESGRTLAGNWQEFLKMLRKARPQCPINGLLLVISSESLISDSTEQLETKAKVLAERLSEMQLDLKVRFPVFVLITKCDKLVGFREYVDDIEDPDMQHQMFGWSNPDSLDTPFQPNNLQTFLDGLTDAVEERRLNRLHDLETSGDERAADKADTLYAFPRSLEAIYPRLQRYLELIFVANAWSQKPLFLRGIYFTSSLQEGAVLDAALAEALGLPVDHLGESGVLKREKAYFLRDVFTAKAFRESGLVTQAINTKALLRKRFLMIYGVGGVCLAGVLALAWFGAKGLEEAVGRQRTYWQAAASVENWQGNKWATPAIESSIANGSLQWKDQQTVPIPVGDEEVPLVDFVAELDELAEQEIRTPMIFLPIKTILAVVTDRDYDRAQALHNVYQASFFRPLMTSTHERLRLDEGQPPPDLEGTLLSLMTLEANYLAEARNDRLPDSYRQPSLTAPFATLTSAALDPRFAEVHRSLYARGGQAADRWPPEGLSNGFSLEVNEPLRAGFDQYLTSLRRDFTRPDETDGSLGSVVEAAKRFAQQERDFWDLIRRASDRAGAEDIVTFFQKQFEPAKEALAKQVRIVSAAMESDGPLLLGEAAVREVQIRQDELFERTVDLHSFLDRPEISDFVEDPERPLFREIQDRLRREETIIRRALEERYDEQELREMRELDEGFLATDGQGQPRFAERYAFYALAVESLADGAGDERKLISRLQNEVEALELDRENLTRRAQAYSGAFANEFFDASKRLIELAVDEARLQLAAAYLAELQAYLKEEATFPLIWDAPSERVVKPNQLDDIRRTLADIERELKFGVDAIDSDSLEARFKNAAEVVGEIRGVADALLANLRVGEYEVSMATVEQHNRTLDRLQPKFSSNNHINFIWRGMSVNARPPEPTGNPRGQHFGTVNLVSDDLMLQFYRRNFEQADSDVAFVLERPWTGIALLRRFASDSRDGSTWQVGLARTADGRDYYMLLDVRFPEPLPVQKDWPVSSQLDF